MKQENIPNNWEFSKIKDVFSLFNGKAFKPSDWDKKGLPIIRIQNLNGSSLYNFYSKQIESRYLVENNDLLFSWSGNIGTSFGPYIWKQSQAVLNQHIFKVVIKNKKITSKKYAYYILKKMTSDAEKIAHGGTGIVHITKKQMESLKIPLPPLPEQKKIADILTTVDEKIESIEKQIEQTELLKKGLMQRLFTQGIGHTEFKNTKIGRIPKEWEVVELKKLIFLKRGFDITKKEQINGFFPVVSSSGIASYHNEYKVKGPGVVLGRKGSIGSVFYIEKDFWPHDTTLWVEDFNSNIPRYSYYFILYFDVKKYGTRTGAPSLNRNDIHPIKIAIPSHSEQKKIASILATVDEKLEILHSKKAQYLTLKKGLMQKLLTGQIRVKT